VPGFRRRAPRRRAVAGPLLLVAVAAVALVSGFVLGAPPAGAGDPAQSPPGYGVTGGDAHQVYLRDCAYCHGAAGGGTTRGPSLVGVGRASVDYWVGTGRMPLPSPDAQDRRGPPAYPRAVIDGLADLVAGFGPGGPDVPKVDIAHADLGKGLELYTLSCSACHVWSGVGGALLHREAPTVLESTPTEIAEAVRLGPGTMPAFGTAALSDRDLDDLVAYVVSLRTPTDRGGNPLWRLGPTAEGAVGWVAGLGLVIIVLTWIGERG
jgi:ubiquinol-cytochrome c reductase cytochrome c subunit